MIGCTGHLAPHCIHLLRHPPLLPSPPFLPSHLPLRSLISVFPHFFHILILLIRHPLRSRSLPYCLFLLFLTFLLFFFPSLPSFSLLIFILLSSIFLLVVPGPSSSSSSLHPPVLLFLAPLALLSCECERMQFFLRSTLSLS